MLFAVVVLFQLITLPVEFDASRRAKQQLHQLGIVSAGEADGVSSVLTAAAMTYVAGALAALTRTGVLRARLPRQQELRSLSMTLRRPGVAGSWSGRGGVT